MKTSRKHKALLLSLETLLVVGKSYLRISVMSQPRTITVCHAVEEEPGRLCTAVLDEGHVMTGFDAEHGEQLHPLTGKKALTTRTVL